MIVLDTAAWIWHASDPDRLSSSAQRAVGDADRLVVSALSVWEVGMLVAEERIGLDRPVERWVTDALALPKVEYAGLEPAVALLATRLPGDLHGDPADRVIVATALARQAAVVTPDRRIRDYPHVPSIW